MPIAWLPTPRYTSLNPDATPFKPKQPAADRRPTPRPATPPPRPIEPRDPAMLAARLLELEPGPEARKVMDELIMRESKALCRRVPGDAGAPQRIRTQPCAVNECLASSHPAPLLPAQGRRTVPLLRRAHHTLNASAAVSPNAPPRPTPARTRQKLNGRAAPCPHPFLVCVVRPLAEPCVSCQRIWTLPAWCGRSSCMSAW